ncbi:MAG: hypothetical protein LC722_05715 [Actinobacteria bacterium]|nr:hypothetical protein [Actinomycetota bacterium]
MPVQGSVSTSGVTLSSGSTESNAGRVAAASAADNDPSQTNTDYSTANATAPSQTFSTSGGGNALSVTLGASNSGTTTSTTSASTARPCNAQTDLQPCGISTASQTATLSSALGLNTGFISLGTANLASIASLATSGITDRALDATGDGRVAASATRTIGDVRIGGLPGGLSALLVPLAWQGYLVGVNGATSMVSAQVGVNTSAPSLAVAGTISVWNGVGYTNVAVAPGSSADIPVAALVIQDPLSPGGLLRLSLSATVRTGGTATSSTSKVCSPTTCPNTRTAASASAGSPAIVDYTFDVTLAGNSIAHLEVHVDLGTLSADATYQEAPSA